MAKKRKAPQTTTPIKTNCAFLVRLVELVEECFGSRVPSDYQYLLELLAEPKSLIKSKGNEPAVFSKEDSSFRADRVFEELLGEFSSDQVYSLVPKTAKASRGLREFAGSVKMGAFEDTIWRRITGYPNWNLELAQAIASRFKGVCALEIMGGNGLTSRCLMDAGLKVICTDIAPGKANDYYSMRGNSYCDVLGQDAVSAVRKFGAKCDLLICSWPPQGEEQVLTALQAYAKVNPKGQLLYFGELAGGVNGTDSFFNSVSVVSELEDINALHCSHIGSKDVIRLFKLSEVHGE